MLAAHLDRPQFAKGAKLFHAGGQFGEHILTAVLAQLHPAADFRHGAATTKAPAGLSVDGTNFDTGRGYGFICHKDDFIPDYTIETIIDVYC